MVNLGDEVVVQLTGRAEEVVGGPVIVGVVVQVGVQQVLDELPPGRLGPGRSRVTVPEYNLVSARRRSILVYHTWGAYTITILSLSKDRKNYLTSVLPYDLLAVPLEEVQASVLPAGNRVLQLVPVSAQQSLEGVTYRHQLDALLQQL